MSNALELPQIQASNYRALLFNELAQRRKKNPLYSLRAFARDLQISTTCLSDVLGQKRNFSKKNADKVARSLGVAPRTEPAEPAADPGRYELRQLAESEFAEVSDWHHYAILNLAKLRSNNASPEWISNRLGIEVEDARLALERLISLGLVQISSGKLHRTSLTLTTSNGVPSASIRKFHRQYLALATRSLDSDPIAAREFATATLAIDPSRIVEAKTMMYDAMERISAFLELGDAGHKKEVYALGIQFIPLTKGSVQDHA